MKSVKRRVLAAILAATVMYGTAVPVFASPTTLTPDQQQELNAAEAEYRAITGRIQEINGIIQDIADEVTDIIIRIEDNEAAMELLQGDIDLKEEEVREAEIALAKKEADYGERLRAMYKQGNRGMLDAILGAESLADLISRADAIMKLAQIDRQLLQEIEDMKLDLEVQKAELDASMEELEAYQVQNEADLAESKAKQAEADTYLEELKVEESKILRNLAMVERYFIEDHEAVINNSSSSDDAIRGAVAALRESRPRMITNESSQKMLELINKGVSVLNQREAARRAEAARQAEAARVAELAAQRASASANASASASNAPSASNTSTVQATASAQAVLDYARRFLGVRYTWGGTSPSSGFDCSGFTQYVFRNFGINLPRVSRSQASVGTRVSYSNLRPGDLVFFSSRPGGTITHVGIYVGNGNMIHAPRPGRSVEITTMRYHNFTTARRVLN